MTLKEELTRLAESDHFDYGLFTKKDGDNEMTKLIKEKLGSWYYSAGVKLNAKQQKELMEYVKWIVHAALSGVAR